MVSVGLFSFRSQFDVSLQRVGGSRLGISGCFVCNVSGLGHVVAIREQPSGDGGSDRALCGANTLRRLFDLGVCSLGFPDRGPLFVARNAYVIL